MKKENIEKKRKKLHQRIDKYKNLSHNEVVQISQDLDESIANYYQRILNSEEITHESECSGIDGQRKENTKG